MRFERCERDRQRGKRIGFAMRLERCERGLNQAIDASCKTGICARGLALLPTLDVENATDHANSHGCRGDFAIDLDRLPLNLQAAPATLQLVALAVGTGQFPEPSL